MSASWWKCAFNSRFILLFAAILDFKGASSSLTGISSPAGFNYKALQGSSKYKFGVLAKIVNYMRVPLELVLRKNLFCYNFYVLWYFVFSVCLMWASHDRFLVSVITKTAMKVENILPSFISVAFKVLFFNLIWIGLCMMNKTNMQLAVLLCCIAVLLFEFTFIHL